MVAAALVDPARLRARPRSWPVAGLRMGEVSVDHRVVLDEPLTALVPEVLPLVRRYALAGEAALSVRINADEGRLSVCPTLQADRLAFAHPAGFRKAVGVPAEVALSASMPADLSKLERFSLHVQAGHLSASARGSAAVRRDSGIEIVPAKAQVTVSTARAGALQEVLPALQGLGLSGEGSLTANWQASGDGDAPVLSFRWDSDGRRRVELGRPERLRIAAGAFQADRLAGRVRGKDVLCHGTVTVKDLRLVPGGLPRFAQLLTEGLELRAGGNRAWLLADVSLSEASAPGPSAGAATAGPARLRAKGKVRLVSTHLDDKDLLLWVSPPGTTHGKLIGGLSAEQARACEARAAAWVALARPLLAGADLEVQASAERVRTYDRSVGQAYELQKLELAGSVRRGRVKVDLSGALNGGRYAAGYVTDVGDPDPIVRRQIEIRRIVATPEIQPQLAKYFPGNTVEGLFTRSEDVAVSLRDLVADALDGRYAELTVGSAKTLAVRGFVEGRAAPKFVTRIFPGLNLTRYRYKSMTGFAEFRKDGTAKNDMIFSGPAYDVYMEGTTDRDNRARYEVGLILLGVTQTPEWNHRWKQGRVPIVWVSGLIEDGKFVDQAVRYPWPNETLGVIFLKNNLFYRIWVNTKGRKGVAPDAADAE